MKKNKLNTSKTGQSLASAVAIGVIVASVLSVLLSALLSNVVLNGRLQETSVSAIVFVIRSISMLLGALIGGAILKKSFLPLVGFTAAGYLLVLLGIGIVFYDGSFKNFLSGIASVLIGGIAALFIIQRPKNKRNKSVKYIL